MQKTELDGLPTPRRYLAIVAMSLGTILAVLDGSIVGVALPTLAKDLNVHASESVMIVTIYQLILVMTVLPFSALGTRVGLRNMYQYGQMTFTVATLLCFFANSLPFLLIVRALQALGAAAALSVASAMVRAIYPARHLGRGLALNTLMVSSSAALAPTLGGLVLAFASWRYIFAVTLPLALVSLWLGRRALPEPEPRDEPYDVLAAVMCAATFGLGISGLEALVHGDSPVIAITILTLGVAVGVLFVKRELRSSEPVLPVDLLAKPAFALSILGALLAFIASNTLLLSMPFRLQQHYGFSPGEVGAMITPWPFALMLVGPISGYLSDRVPAAVLGGVGLIMASVALLFIAWLPENVSHWQMAWRMALAGAGFGLFFAPNTRLMVSSTPMHRAASAGGLISTNRLTGQTLGATLLAALLSHDMGEGRASATIAMSLTIAALICTMVRLRQPAANNPATHK